MLPHCTDKELVGDAIGLIEESYEERHAAVTLFYNTIESQEIFKELDEPKLMALPKGRYGIHKSGVLLRSIEESQIYITKESDRYYEGNFVDYFRNFIAVKFRKGDCIQLS